MTEKHRAVVLEIFNYYVANSYAAYPEVKVGDDYSERFLHAIKGYPAVVVRTKIGQVVGFAILRPYRTASIFNRTAEITYFILPEHTGKGLGKTILDHFITEAKKLGIDNLLAHTSSLNEVSLEFHRKHGFQECGRLKQVGTKFGKSFDIVWMQKRI
jgi:L-amino acid N-acyltransferase YncA